MEEIIRNEGKHFPLKRSLNFLLTLALLFTTSMMLGNKYQVERLVDPIYSYVFIVLFILYALISTYFNAKELRRVHMVKRRDGYVYDPNDITFEDNKSMIQVIIYCFIAGVLGGIVGIAGGIILGPLFLHLGMRPTVVANTN